MLKNNNDNVITEGKLQVWNMDIAMGHILILHCWNYTVIGNVMKLFVVTPSVRAVVSGG
jgi:hypothetical protein